MEETVTLALGGTVSLDKFAKALDRLTATLRQLSAEAGAQIEWVIAGLDYSSSIATAAGRAKDERSEPLVARVVSRFGEAGEFLAYGRPTTAASVALSPLRDIVALIGNGVEEVRFETSEHEAIIRAVDRMPSAPSRPLRDRGSVIGRVQTLQGRGKLRFTLYDLRNDRAVSCYLSPGQEEQMRGAWGHLVEVSGVVSRDPMTNLPLSVRQVSDLTVLPEPQPDAWLAARGAIQAPDAPPAAIRRERGWARPQRRR